MADEISIVVRADDQFSGVLSNFGNIMTGIKSTIDLVGDALRIAGDFVGQFVDSASESEQAVARLNGVLRATGGAAGLTSQQLTDMATSLQGITRFSDETILAGESILLTFRNISGETFERTVPAMLDMAEIFGSVDSAAMQLGKALNDPLNGMGALSRAGVTFSDEQKEVIKAFVESGDIASAQAVILGELEAQVGGLSQTMGQTFAGQLEIAKNKLDDVKELIGGAFLPVFVELLNKIVEFGTRPEVQKFIQDFAVSLSAGLQTLIPLFDSFMSSLETIGNLIASGDFSAIGNMFQNAITNIDWNGISNTIADGLKNIDWVKVGQVIGSALSFIGNIIDTIITNIDWAALGSALAISFGNLIAAIIGYANWDALVPDLSAGFQYALVGAFGEVNFQSLSTDFVNGFRYIGQQIASAFGYYGWDAWNQLWSDFEDGWNYVYAKIKNMLGINSPSTVFSDIARNLVQGLINGWNSLFTSFTDLISSGIDAILELFAPFLALFGIDVSSGTSAGGLGTAGGGTAGTGSSSDSGGQVTNNYYFYGTTYVEGVGPDGTYDCTPSPVITTANQTLNTSGI